MENYQAIHRRLGNIDAIGHIRKLILSILSAESALISKVLYSATHCGDIIASDALPALRADLARVKTESRVRSDPYGALFLQEMEDLILAAEAEENPIVFT